MFHNKKKSYCFFQRVDSNSNLFLILQSPHSPTNFWQFCFSNNIFENSDFGCLHRGYIYEHDEFTGECIERYEYSERIDCNGIGETTALPNLIEIRQQYQNSIDQSSSSSNHYSTIYSPIKPLDTTREHLSYHLGDSMEYNHQELSNSLLHVQTNLEIHREEISGSIEGEKVLRNYLFSM